MKVTTCTKCHVYMSTCIVSDARAKLMPVHSGVCVWTFAVGAQLIVCACTYIKFVHLSTCSLAFARLSVVHHCKLGAWTVMITLNCCARKVNCANVHMH